MRLIGSTSFGFAQNTIQDFPKYMYRIELIETLSLTNATKNKINKNIDDKFKKPKSRDLFLAKRKHSAKVFLPQIR